MSAARTTLLAAALLILGGARLAAQDADAPPKPAPAETPKEAAPTDEAPKQEAPVAPEPAAEAGPEGWKDPTVADPELQRLLGGAASPTGASRIRSTRLPEVALRGRVFVEGREPAALIEVEGRTLLIRKGSELTLTTASSVIANSLPPPVAPEGAARARPRTATLNNLVLKVTKIDDQVVEFEILETRQTLVVR